MFLGVLPLVLHSLGAPLGEPFADDFDYLHHALLTKERSLFDGFGAILYWRPLGRQAYYGILAPLILEHPRLIATLHVVLLAIAALLLYRALRPRLSPAAAALAAAFPLLAESTRMLIAWPSNFMDLGAILFALLALHETVRRRLPTALAAMLASLLTKEVGAAVALLLPWVPAAPLSRHERLRWTGAMALLVLSWAVVYIVVYRHAGLTMPHQYVDPAAAATPALARYAWAVGHAARTAFSLAAIPGPIDRVVGLSLGVLAVLTFLRLALASRARRQVRMALPWMAWGLGWFLLAAAPLIELYPAWAPYRGIFGAIGLGIALSALAAAAHPALLALLLAVCVVAFSRSPAPPKDVSFTPRETGAALDFSRVVRLERLMSGARDVLRPRHRPLAPGSVVVFENLPEQTEYAFAGNRAVQVWYRDTTLRTVGFHDYQGDSSMRATTIVEFTDDPQRPLALVEPAAMQSLLVALRRANRGEWKGALAEVGRADSLQTGPNATVFEGALISTRSVAMLGLGDSSSAERLARESLAKSSRNRQARWVLIQIGLGRSHFAEVEAQVETLLVHDADDQRARQLRDALRAMRRGGLGPPPSQAPPPAVR